MPHIEQGGIPPPGISGDVTGFDAALQGDERRARKGVLSLFSNTEQISDSQRTTLRILAGLYPLLRGKLYPERSAPAIARRLHQSIAEGHPVVLCGVLALDTAMRELPFVSRAARVFQDNYPHNQVRSVLIDWPVLEERRTMWAIAHLTDDPDLVTRSAAVRSEEVRNLWELLGYPAQDMEIVAPTLELRHERRSGAYLTLSGPEDFVAIATAIRQGGDQGLSKNLDWLFNFMWRQRTMSGLDESQLLAAAQFTLTVRTAVGRRLELLSSGKLGLTLGLTTELNPQLLRLYGKGVYLANLNVKPEA